MTPLNITRAIARMTVILAEAVQEARNEDLRELAEHGHELPHLVADFIHEHVDFLGTIPPGTYSADDLDAAFERLCSILLALVGAEVQS